MSMSGLPAELASDPSGKHHVQCTAVTTMPAAIANCLCRPLQIVPPQTCTFAQGAGTWRDGGCSSAAAAAGTVVLMCSGNDNISGRSAALADHRMAISSTLVEDNCEAGDN